MWRIDEAPRFITSRHRFLIALAWNLCISFSCSDPDRNFDNLYDPQNAHLDYDGDGLSNGSDPCPTDPENDDPDNDSLCGMFDRCPEDPTNSDPDQDALCGVADPCPDDPTNTDPDTDGLCADADPCPMDPMNACCIPNCAGRGCGDDGCGGTCGSCSNGAVCISFRCEQPCVPRCTGLECGDDGCGRMCGVCDSASCMVCSSGNCVAGNPCERDPYGKNYCCSGTCIRPSTFCDCCCHGEFGDLYYDCTGPRGCDTCSLSGCRERYPTSNWTSVERTCDGQQCNGEWVFGD